MKEARQISPNFFANFVLEYFVDPFSFQVSHKLLKMSERGKKTRRESLRWPETKVPLIPASIQPVKTWIERKVCMYKCHWKEDESLYLVEGQFND
jgi:hypothetical protein